MAHPTGTTARVQRLTALVAIVLVAMAVGFAFGRVFVGHGATYRLLAVGVASAVVAWSFERRSLLLATIVSAALLIVAIGLFVFPATTWYGAPTLETLRQMGHAAAQVGEEARIQISPAPPNDSLMLAAITAVWAAVFSCFALAFRAGSPLLALVPPVALVAFADSVLDGIIKPVYGVLFLIAALAVVFADSLRRIHGWGPVWSPPGTRNRLLPSAGRGARRVAAGVVALAAIAPIVVPGFGSKAVIDLESLNHDDRVHVSPLVQIGAILNQAEDVEVFDVQTDHPSYWRMVGLDVMDGIGGWNQAPEQGMAVQPNVSLTPEHPIDPGIGTETIDATFTVQNDLAFTTLPIAYQPNVLVSAEDSVTWFPHSQALSVGDWPDRGAQYSVRSAFPTPTANDLRNAQIGTEADYPGETELPQGMPDEVGELARQWTKGAKTAFDKALAIQDHLRGSDFHYDKTKVYPAGLDSLVTFLKDDKTGFCEQFAPAMAAMLRTLHIPARVATGFTTGAEAAPGSGTYRLRTSNLHAWVEVAFEGYGWLPFEPTPGLTPGGQLFSNPAMDSYLSGTASGACRGGGCTGDKGSGGDGVTTPTPPAESKACNPQNPRVRPTTKCADSNDDGAIGTTGTSGREGGGVTAPEPTRVASITLLLWMALVAAVVLAGIPIVRWVGRRRKLRHAAREPRALVLATYDVFSERAADLGLGRGGGETPAEYRRRIEATDLLTDGHMERLTGTVVRAAYSTRSVTQDDVLDASADADQVLRDLRRATPLRRRILGVYRRD
jgi:transglutaminase-like putative cysteine protease